MRRAAAGSLAAAFLAVAAQAQSIGLGERAKLHYRGHAGVVQWAFPQEGGSRQSHFTTQWVGDLDLTLSLSPSAPLELRVHPRLNYDIDRSRAFPARFDDLYLDFFTRWFELRAGYQVFSFKVVESISQADVLNQVDREEDFLDPPKIGEPAARARFILPTPSQNVLELYYLPRFTPAPLPGPESRYYFFTDRSLRLLREQDDFTYGSEDGRLRPQWAARWQTQVSGFDVSLHYFHGYRRFPLFRPVGAPDSAGTLVLTHYYPPLYQGGLTFQGALGNWLWKGETAYTRYEQDLHGPSGAAVDPFLAYTAGFEYTFYSPFIQNHDLGAIVELVGDSDVDKDEEDLEGFRPFHTYLFAGIRYALSNTGDRSFLAGALLDYVNLDAIYQLEYTERLFDRMGVKAGLSGVAARSSSQFRPFRQAARISGELKYHF